MKTLQEIEQSDKAFLDVEDVAEFLGAHPQSIRNQAHLNPLLLGFPVNVLGNRVRIPRDGFVYFYKFGRTV